MKDIEEWLKEFEDDNEEDKYEEGPEDAEPGFWYLFLGISSFAAAVGIAYYFASEEAPTYFPFLGLGLLFLSGFFVFSGFEIRFLAKKFLTYGVLLADDQKKSISNLAKALNVPEKEVKQNIKEIISKGICREIAINEQKGTVIVLSNQSSVSNESFSDKKHIDTKSRRRVLTVKCNGCGASNKVPEGSNVRCEYCGAHISE